MPDAKEFARSVFTRIMSDRNLGHSKARPLKLLRHFNANDAALRFERDGFEDATAKQPEIAVDIPNGKPERRAHRATVQFAGHDSIPRISAFDLVSVDEI